MSWSSQCSPPSCKPGKKKDAASPTAQLMTNQLITRTLCCSPVIADLCDIEAVEKWPVEQASDAPREALQELWETQKVLWLMQISPAAILAWSSPGLVNKQERLMTWLAAFNCCPKTLSTLMKPLGVTRSNSRCMCRLAQNKSE